MLSFVALLSSASAEEGMWLPEQIPGMAAALAAQGLGLDAARLADPTGDPLGAVVSMGGCTASFLSAEGLMGTNGHCVASYLEYASDKDHPYARDGYVASDRSKELWAGPSARVWVTEKIEDVTTTITAKFKKKMGDTQRQDAIEAASKALVAVCETTPNRRCAVVPFYDGREYRLITRLEIRDLRVSYVPPESIYAFGGDEDNWMWPRQCGDFALIRAYVAPDGTPAAHADTNVPYKPPRHLRVQPAGARSGDFVMIAGYPGSTFRYRTALEAEHAVSVRYPEGLKLLGALSGTAKTHARKDPDAAARLQQSLFNWANTRKSYEGMLANFVASDIVARKKTLEGELDAWTASDRGRTAKYAAAIAELRTVLAKDLSTHIRDRLTSGLMFTGRLLGVAATSYRWASERERADVARDAGFQDRDLADVQDRFRQLERSLHPVSDRDLFKVILGMTQELPSDQRITPIDTWLASAGGIEPGLDTLYASTALFDTGARLKLLQTSRAELEASTDPWVRLAVSLETWQRGVRSTDKAENGALARLRPAYMDALRELRAGQFYPDANGTLRLSFGHVEGYSPKEGVVYTATTSLAGLARKAGPAPFDAPSWLLERAKSVQHDVPVNFLSTLDNTGGSSGSPTLNAKGEVVGFVFDRNWDAVAADWIYDPATTRSIHADVRYLLWLLGETAGAQPLVAELVGK